MKRTITVVYDGEVLRPLEPVDLEPNTRWLITVEDTEPVGADQAGDLPLLKYLELARELDLPPDFASQKHHYLDGHPKV